MKYGIIIGSHRAVSQSSKVGERVRKQLLQLDTTGSCYVYDLRKNPLPFWDESKWDSTSSLSKTWEPIGAELNSCDAFVFISPEWSGMVPAGLKNFFLYCGTELAHKPAMLVGVSSGKGGSYPIAELRMSSYKNTHVCYIPEHVIVSNVESVFNDDNLDENNKADAYIKKRMRYALQLLVVYGQAFAPIRTSKHIDHETYPYGM